MLVSIAALQRHFREDGFCLLPLFGKWKGKNFIKGKNLSQAVIFHSLATEEK